MGDIKPLENACPICQGLEYEWGTLQGQHAYVPDDANVLAKAFPLPKSFRTRQCLKCGNLQVFAPVD